jgi:hypothetical protein
MAKASPMVRSFNAGEFSELLEGRTDLDRYPASMRKLVNFIAAPQGPAISRSGTAFVAPVNDHGEYSALLPFVFSNEQAKLLEFASDRIRFVDEDGLQVYEPVAMTMGSAAGAAMVFTSASLAAEVGDQVVLLGFPAEYNLNGEVANVTAKLGTTYTIDKVYPNLSVVNGNVARVYHVPCTLTEDQRKAMRFVQSVDVLYLLTTARPRKLSRYGDYDWRLEAIDFVDGPYMPINTTSTSLTPSATGNAVPAMTDNLSPSGEAAGSDKRPTIPGTVASPAPWLGRNITYTLDASDYFYAFDDNDETYWAGGSEQSGFVQYAFPAGAICDGYTIYVAFDNQDTSYLAADYAPSTFEFQGYDGTKWVTLDRQENYVLYDNNKSVFFEIDNDVSHSAYRLSIQKLMRNGPIEPRVRRLAMRSKTTSSFVLTASSTIGINNDTGFQTTDVGRLIRLKGSDGAWRSVRISARTSATSVTVELLGEPLLDVKAIKQWRLGFWSDTTGWPTVGDFFEDRLWLAGPDEYPDQFAGSVTGAYETFSQTDTFGEVLDDSAVVGRLNSRRLSRVRWLSSDERGLIMGTGSEEYALAAPNNEALTARNIKARPTTRRGSAGVEPVRIDSQVLYVQRSGRTIREFAYVYEADGYKSPSMSQLASHLGATPFVEMDYAAEPHSIVWIRRQDGSLVGLTYNREENVIGWHRHDLSGGVIESLAVLPQKDQLQDALWVVVKRNVNGTDKRYIERLTRFWDFDTMLEDAHFVDSGLRYTGVPTRMVYGLQHLEGEEVYGLADARPVGPFTVENGSVTLPFEASNIIIGLGYDSEAETARLENGAADGTAMGKVKRINSIVGAVWNSVGGEIGVYNEQEDRIVYNELEYPGRFDEIEDIELYTGMIGPFVPEAGYGMRGSLAFRRPKSSPLPFNLVALMPQMNTQDR